MNMFWHSGLHLSYHTNLLNRTCLRARLPCRQFRQRPDGTQYGDDHTTHKIIVATETKHRNKHEMFREARPLKYTQNLDMYGYMLHVPEPPHANLTFLDYSWLVLHIENKHTHTESHRHICFCHFTWSTMEQLLVFQLPVLSPFETPLCCQLLKLAARRSARKTTFKNHWGTATPSMAHMLLNEFTHQTHTQIYIYIHTHAQK